MAFIQAKESIYFMFRVAWLIIISVIILMVVGTDVSREIDTAEIRANTLVKKAIYSKDCFAYEDVRVKPFVIDVKKFTTKRIDNCIGVDKFSAKFMLYYGDKVKEAINNEDRFLVDKRLCNFKNYACVNLNKTILVYDGKNIIQGRIHINATQSN